MTLYEKSQQLLELPAVLDMLSQEAVSPAAKESALALTPAGDIHVIRDRLRETSAAKELITKNGSPPGFSGVRDVNLALRRAEMGGSLNTRELLDVAQVLRAARLTAAYRDGSEGGKTAIDWLFSALHPNKYLEEKLTNSIAAEDEIADAASPELADIRRHMRAAAERARSSLQKIISSPSYAKALQEPIITMRSDRYVVPVKAEHKAAVPGLVHDISASGATLFIEPMSAVKANNEIRELLAKEKNEIDRILAALSAECASFSEDIVCDVNVLAQLDLIFAKAKLSFSLDCGEPELSEDGQLILRRARHPLLPRGTAVPIDATLGVDFDTLVITGPNTGGKTVTLKTIGLLCLMAQCGLHIPAGDGSVVPVYTRVLADIGDEQSIEQSLSTFSAHMTNIVGILSECGEGTLVLFDELGAGTDPVEGAALAIAIIEYARDLGAAIAATTHYAELKAYATTQSGVQNASCEFDVETLRPTYKLLIGIPGKSNAFAISRRLGLPETVIEDAARRVDSGTADFEAVIEGLERTRQDMERERLETRKLLKKAEEDAAAAAEKKASIDKEYEKARVTAAREAERMVQDARAAVDEVYDELAGLRRQQSKDIDWQRTNEARTLMRASLNRTEEGFAASLPSEAAPEKTRDAVPGDTVEILSLGTRAEVISVLKDGTLSLQAGMMKLTAGQDEVRVVDTPKSKQAKRTAASVAAFSAGPSRPEIDLRGMTAVEAAAAAEKFIDGAQLAHMETVTIIHGKGTGAVRAAVQDVLRRSKQVKSFRLGRYGEGEDGVTVVTMK